MKIAVITNRTRCEKFSDPAMIPDGAELIYFEHGYTAEEVIARAGDAEFILVDTVLPVSAEIINNMPNLKMIHSEGVGYAEIDIEAARKRGIYVSNNYAVNAGQVAEHTVMLALTVLRHFAEGEAALRQGRQMEMKMKLMSEGLEDLIDKRIGIVGFGAIGKELAKRLHPFGCSLYYYSRTRASAEEEEAYHVTYLSQDELFATSDIITLHVPVTNETKGLICKKTLEMMKPSAIVINTARGAVVNTADLAEAIVNGTIYGCALDTFDPEPVPADDPILLLPEPYRWRVSVSPHIAGVTLSQFYASYRNIWNDVAKVLRGERPSNIVNGL